MPRIKPFSSYPTLFSEAVHRVVSQGQAIDLNFESLARAQAWRGQFHAFIGSAYKAAREHGASEETKEFARLASRVLLTLREPELGQFRVTLQDRDRGWQAEALEQALATGVRQLGAPNAVPSPESLGLVPLAPQPDGTVAPPSERSEERAADKDPANVPGKSNKDKYY